MTDFWAVKGMARHRRRGSRTGDQMTDPTRPALRWHGGKWRLAPWIISHFPPHRTYVEPFGGAASVMIRKARSYAEVYNDLDDDVVGLFRVLRDPVKAARLVELLRLTPFARVEFRAAYERVDDDVEEARRLIVRSFMGFGSNANACREKGATSTGFRANTTRSGTTPAQDWAGYPEALTAIVERMRGVVIEQVDAIACIEKHDGPKTLVYADPPYLPETRAISRATGGMRGTYRHEMTPSDHEALLACLRGCRSMVIVSGYPATLYDKALTGWRRVEVRAHADGARPRTEVIWMNPAAHRAAEATCGPLFFEDEKEPGP